jgi:3' terminal RNA ribose 2'-O-methyltransferase Hen1
VYLTCTSTAPNATDLGYLLHKNPSRAQSFDLPVGTAHVFYPEAGPDRCTVALLLEVDPIALVRGKRFGGGGSVLAQYVNDRPYAASSMLAVALGRVFRTAMTGRCSARPDLEGKVLPLEIHVPAVPSDGGVELVRRLFAPRGWSVAAVAQPLDPEVPAWGESRYVDLRLAGALPLEQALSHLYVLLPVLDGAKHYWVSVDEVDKLIRNGEGWLADHPERDLITRRYLARQRSFVEDATARLTSEDDSPAGPAGDFDVPAEPAPDLPLSALRRRVVLRELKAAGAARVVDLGCGEGALLRELLADPAFTDVLGVDVSPVALQRAERRLALDRMPDSVRARLRLRQSSLTYSDGRLAGFDAAVLMEVIEHVDLPRLPALEHAVFGAAQPTLVLVTTPNAEYNVVYDPSGRGMRHADHRFEWGRAEFRAWTERIAGSYGYDVRHEPVGEPREVHGPPTQLAVFSRRSSPVVSAEVGR